MPHCFSSPFASSLATHIIRFYTFLVLLYIVRFLCYAYTLHCVTCILHHIPAWRFLVSLDNAMNPCNMWLQYLLLRYDFSSVLLHQAQAHPSFITNTMISLGRDHATQPLFEFLNDSVIAAKLYPSNSRPQRAGLLSSCVRHRTLLRPEGDGTDIFGHKTLTIATANASQKDHLSFVSVSAQRGSCAEQYTTSLRPHAPTP
jgi:hypothetical protein